MCVSACLALSLLPAVATQPTARELLTSQRWATDHLAPTDAGPAGPGLIVHANHGAVQPDARGAGPLKLGAVTFPTGLYCHAPSRIGVRLPSPGARFRATVGVDTNNQTSVGRGSVVFAVKLGEREVFRSALIREGTAPAAVDVDLAGARAFEILVEDGGDGNACDQADWCEATVLLADGKELRLGELPFAESEPAGLPFSFRYGGQASAELLARWRRSDEVRQLKALRAERTTTWEDPASGLTTRCLSVTYADFPVVEWTVWLTNGGTADTPLIEDLRGLDLRLRAGPEYEFALSGITGDNCSPDSYQPWSKRIDPGTSLRSAAVGGRPTQVTFPCYNLAAPAGGMIVAIGWPGQWAGSFEREAAGSLRLRAGQETTHLLLHPGETIRTQLQVLMFWDGTDRVRAQNLWRRWMLAHNTPNPGGRPVEPLLAFCDGAFYPGLKITAQDEMRAFDKLQQERVKLDYWWMDAGWYPCGDWADGVGNWEPDPQRFPRGLREVTDHVHAQGTKSIVWFEPERVAPGTWLDREHPDWLLGAAGGMRLLNLGHPDAWAWLTGHIDTLLTAQGIDLYRQDFNIDPLGYWLTGDTADRQGFTENQYVQGYLAWWDELIRRHPGLLIDSCASGGRRNDLETLRRAVPLLRSDYQSFSGDSSYAIGNQGHTYGLSSWIPYYGQGVYVSPDEMVYSARSYTSPAFGFAVDPRRPDVDWDLYRKLVADWRALAPAYLGDFYPLLPYSLDEGAWTAWQFDLPEQGRGQVQVFRHKASDYLACAFRLRGLDPDAEYRVRDLDTGRATVHRGKELAEQGLRVEVAERPGAVVMVYERVK
ncbi:MAG: alpha-galactosidase [Armatimonadetes bacterium]|nr:alpha-galactosidase [Armatimonadota bacterium]